MFFFSVMRFIHEPLARICEATPSHALTLTNRLLLLLLINEMNETFLEFLPLVKLVAKFSKSLSISAFCLYEKKQCKHFEVEFLSNELLTSDLA